MKQHITPKQRNELSKKGKERYKELWIKKYLKQDKEIMKLIFGKVDKEFPDVNDKISAEADYESKKPLLNIGMMIEFIDEPDIPVKDMIIDTEGGLIEIRLGFDCLVDKLWKACKEIFER